MTPWSAQTFVIPYIKSKIASSFLVFKETLHWLIKYFYDRCRSSHKTCLSPFSHFTTAYPPLSNILLPFTKFSNLPTSPRLWNQLPASLPQACTNLSNCDSSSSLSGTSSIGPIDSPLSSSIILLVFHSKLKPSFSANPSHSNLPFLLQDWLNTFPGLYIDTPEHIRFLLFNFWFRATD